jgi:hypothetical protein
LISREVVPETTQPAAAPYCQWPYRKEQPQRNHEEEKAQKRLRPHATLPQAAYAHVGGLIASPEITRLIAAGSTQDCPPQRSNQLSNEPTQLLLGLASRFIHREARERVPLLPAVIRRDRD